MNSYRKGFTIVELLIVIVVIAILASISVVAYNGVQDRARNAQIATAADVYKKALEMYRVDHGEYPSGQACLGLVSDYPAKDGFAAGQCMYSSVHGVSWSVNNGINDKLLKYISRNPELPSTQTKIHDFYYRGMLYGKESGGSYIYLQYYLPGYPKECVAGFEASGSPWAPAIYTQCRRQHVVPSS